MPSDTPTPAEIAAQIMNSKSFDGAKWHDIDTPDIIHILGVLAEHYHLLPKAEPTDTYDHCREEPMVGWEIEQGPHFVRVLDDEVQLEYDGEPEAPISPEAARYFASALASAADVAEEPK